MVVCSAVVVKMRTGSIHHVLLNAASQKSSAKFLMVLSRARHPLVFNQCIKCLLHQRLLTIITPHLKAQVNVGIKIKEVP